MNYEDEPEFTNRDMESLDQREKLTDCNVSETTSQIYFVAASFQATWEPLFSSNFIGF